MKKLWCVAVACLLAGCTAEVTMETVADEQVMSQSAVREVHVEMPEETVLPVMETDTGELYICREFEVSVETLPGGDLRQTVAMLTGFDLDDVTVMEREADGKVRYDLAWSCAGELGEEVGRASILSDGQYHYCLAVRTPEENADQYREIFNGMLESFTLE